MEDVLTEAPPPSRFFDEDLNIFASPPPPLPSPFLILPNPNPNPPIHTPLLIIAASPAAIHLLRGVPGKNLVGSLVLPENHFAAAPIGASAGQNSIDIFSIDDDGGESVVVLIALAQCPISDERARAVAKVLIGGVSAEKVLILGRLQSCNFRGKVPPDEELGFKLETAEQRASSTPLIEGFGGWFPSGSVVDGFCAAVLSECQLRRIKGTLWVTWPEFGASAVSVVKKLLKKVLPGVEIGSELGFDRFKSSFDSELYA
ncbi:hypothetical protein Scep_020417 [Stephania cephalantha]|uniref:Proteasome assembly chaperone 1 n=1 Tax=Stephania cephalantha TaxID=152367 RepID=A0AAP0NN59_9MAGN